MPVLTDEEVGLASPKVLSDADVGLALSDADVGLTDERYLGTDIAPKGNVELRAEQATLRSANEGGAAVTALTQAEHAATVLENPLGAVLALPENALRSAGVNMPYTSKAPLISREAALKAIEFITPGGGGSEGSMTQSMQEFIAETLSTLTSPDMIGYMMAAKKAPVPVGRYFQGEMLGQVPAAVAVIGESESGGEKTKAALGVAAGVAFPAAIEHGLGKAATVVQERARQVGPATEAAVRSEAAPEAPKATPAPVERVTTLEAPKPELEAPKLVQPVKAAKKAATEVKRVAKDEGQRDAKQIKEELITEIQARLQKAPSEAKAGDTVTIEIPGDGVFTVKNSVEALSELLVRAKKIKTDSGKPPGVPKDAVKASAAAIREFEGQLTKKPEAEPTGLGAATPAEFELKPRNETSIKNATVDQERVQRGLPPAMEPARRSFGAVWDQAMTKMDADYQYPDRLVAELREKPRAITDVEDATLLHRQVELQNEYTKAARDLAQAFDDGRLEDVELQKVRVAGLSDQLLDLYNINKAAGTETARGLNARKMLAYEDFTLAKMELEKRAAKGGEQLTDAERSEVVRVNKRVDETQKAYDEYVERTEERARGEAADRALKEVEALEPPKEPLEKITEGLQEKFMAGQADAITSLIQKLARYFVAQGIKERDPLLAAVHDVVKTIDPTLTPRDTMDAISGYGKYRRLSKDEISKELRDLKGQMQQVSKLEDMQAGRPPLKTGQEGRVPSVEESRLIRLVNEAKNKFQVPITDAATQLKSPLDMLKTRLRNRMTELEDKLVRKDFTKAPRRVIQLDAEAQRLHFEAAKVKARWHEALMKDRLARRSVPAKIIGGIGETANTIRAIMTSGEFSGVFRQGGFTGFGNPVILAKAFPALIRGMRSEAQQHAVNMEIMARPNYPMYVRSKLFLSEHGQKLSQMEEAYMSRWAGKIPVVAGTQRAHSTFLNKLRTDAFDVLAKTLVRRTGELTPERAADISNFLNVSTGRGSLGVRGDAALVAMNTAFFAPRWVASRFQLLIGQPFWKPIARKDWPMVRLIAEQYGRFLIAIGVIYGLWGMAGGEEVETDTRSSDAGKLKIGNTRIDLMAGLQQQTVLISRVASGETKRLSGAVAPIRGEDIPFGRGDSAAVIGNFLRGKLAPVPASGLDLLSGKDVVNRPVTLESELTELSTPLTYRDIYKAMVEQGVPEGTALALLAIFGAGVQTYDR